MQQQNIGKQILLARKKLNFTQKELADRLCVSDKTISKWERGNGYPDISMLIPLCKELHIDVSLLLGESEQLVQNEEHRLKSFSEYAMLRLKENKERIRKNVWILFSFFSVLAIGICLLCDYVIFHSFTWSIITTASICYGWLILTVLLLAKQKIIEKTLAMAMVMIFPYLYIISTQVSLVPNMLRTSLIIALGADILVLLYYAIIKFGTYSLWYKGALIVFISGFFNFFIDKVMNTPYSFFWIQIIGTCTGTLILLLLGYHFERKKYDE